MIAHPRLALLVISLLVGACARPQRVTERPPCPVGWLPQANVDSLITLCVPPGFRLGWNTSTSAQWASVDASPDQIASLSVTVYESATDTVDGRWPRPLAGPPTCGASCWTVDSLVTSQDTVRGQVIHVERGRVQGGRLGLAPHLAFIASWEPHPTWRVDARGIARSAATLDSLRQMLRTATIASGIR